MTDVEELSPAELLLLHGRIAEELRRRGITRTSNNPTGDLAEFLFCKAFGWHQHHNSKANIDAVDDAGQRSQIKGRRVTRHNGSRQLSAIRELESGHFDFLAGVVFDEDYTVLRAAIVPRELVTARATFVKRTNSHKFVLRDDVWDAPGVQDVTAQMQAAIRSLERGLSLGSDQV